MLTAEINCKALQKMSKKVEVYLDLNFAVCQLYYIKYSRPVTGITNNTDNYTLDLHKKANTFIDSALIDSV